MWAVYAVVAVLYNNRLSLQLILIMNDDDDDYDYDEHVVHILWHCSLGSARESLAFCVLCGDDEQEIIENLLLLFCVCIML